MLLDESTAVYGIPYLDPRAAGPSLGVQPTHAAVLEAVAERIRADLARRPGVRGIVMAHCFAVGGAAYLVARAIKGSKVVGFEDLGMEAIHEFVVEDMPVTVAVDSTGTSVHKTGPEIWRKKIAEKQAEMA